MEKHISVVLEEKNEVIQKLKSSNFSKSLAQQSFQEILKKKEKWTDDLFPPDKMSIYSGKTEWSNYGGGANTIVKLNIYLTTTSIGHRQSKIFSPICVKGNHEAIHMETVIGSVQARDDQHPQGAT